MNTTHEESDNENVQLDLPLNVFLLSQGIPSTSLPHFMELSSGHLVPLIDGYRKKDKAQTIYVCVCNSGHVAFCGPLEFSFSKWSFRVIGKEVYFCKGNWKFKLSEIPVSPNVFFIVSRRTKVNEFAGKRADMGCVSPNKQVLQRKVKGPESQRSGNQKRNSLK